jgi:3',5'-cyclic AMP phosphodiesterase CpdA
MLTVLHISDLHFGPPYLPSVGDSLLQKASALKPDVIVASGDFTQRAKPEQFEAARDFLDQLPNVPRVVVPGNHDVPLYRVTERLNDPLGLYRKYICPELNHVVQVNGAVFVALDSTAPRRAITNGRISLEQLEYCAQAFADAPDGAARVVVAHHHFAPAPDYERDQFMPRAKRAMDRFLQLDVELILGGHLHRAYIGNSLDIYPGGRKRHGIIIAQCGTSTSRRGRARERERNSFNLIKLGDEMMRITHYMYFDDVREFGPLSRHIFPRSGRRFIEGTLHTPD